MQRVWVLAALAIAVLACGQDSPTSLAVTQRNLGPALSVMVSGGPHRTITVDGDASDWTGIAPLIVDAANDLPPNPFSTADLLSIRAANDSDNLYFLVEAVLPPGHGVLMFLDTDQDPATGCPNISGPGEELGAEAFAAASPKRTISGRTTPPFVTLAQLGAFGQCGGTGAGSWFTAAFDGRIVEFAVPLSALYRVGVSGTFDFKAGAGVDVTAVAGYRIAAAPQPVQPVVSPCDNFSFQLFHGPECNILKALRDPSYFSIAASDASDTQLLSYIDLNRDELQFLLDEVDYGRDLKAFLDLTTSSFPHEREFYRQLDQASDAVSWVEKLSVLVTAAGNPLAGSLLNQSAGVFGTLLLGIQVYKAGLITITNFDTRQMITDYFATRKSLGNAAAAWADIYNTYGTLVVEIISARQNIHADQVGTWLENAYLAYRLVGYADSPSIRQGYGRGIARAARLGL